jgi:hypothetical protein
VPVCLLGRDEEEKGLSQVKFYEVTQEQLDAQPVTDGNLYFVTDKDVIVYDLDGSRHFVNDTSDVEETPEVSVSDTEPTDPNVLLWFDTSAS